ncbi:MAG: phenylalanine--tRNA ligase subunit beta [Deltaproteobacteria bacterium]|nr:phenylalanine--tRNA ligase subunit beta [Deltaproteobacteria bacterium]
MKLSSSWLSRYMRLPKNLDPILEKLTHRGLEVESVQKRTVDTPFLHVAEIIESKKHPNADRLSLCRVKTKEREYAVVCGAKNYKDGNKVILALPGAKLSGGLEIKENTIRGERSEGMLCSKAELGFEEKSEGILILPAQTSLTADVQKVLGGGEVTFELNITPNRPDGMSFLGVARELAPILRRKVQYPKMQLQEEKQRIQEKIKIKLEAPKKCPRYMARFISGVKIGASPEWLKTALESIGQRSINNVVDVTNFVLMEWGQPLHAFDFDKISDATVVIRSAKPQEKIQTLDGDEYTLSPEDLLICDAQKPIALAGIMGGASSEVSESTVNILLESAYFDPSTIRKTSKKLGLSSESSKRFERGVDIEGVQKALDRSAQLILEVAGGTIAKGAMDLYPKKFSKCIVSLRQDRLEQYLGYALPFARVKKDLQDLGFKIKGGTSLKSRFEVPSYRVDIAHEVDLIEEIARSRGYDKIPTLELSGSSHLEQRIEKDNFLSAKVKSALVSAGLSEVVNYSFYSPLDLEKIHWQEKITKIQNPLGEDFSVMRPSLLPSLLKNLKFNLDHGCSRVRIFELRPVYNGKGQETKMLSGLISGSRYPTHWDLKEEEVDFYDVKAIVHLISNTVGIWFVDDCEIGVYDSSLFHPHLSAEIRLAGNSVFRFGKIHPDIRQTFDLKQAAYVFECNFNILEKDFQSSLNIFKPLPKYPFVKRDLSLLIPAKKIHHKALHEIFFKVGGHLVKKAELFDVYEGEAIPEGYKSYAYALTYGSDDRTLTDQEVSRAHEDLCRFLEREWHIKIR